ncbi:hypothetical protein SAMN04489860_0312 [Paraoerskovia marina]|uniref:Uncharacterized protein n=1 Tax=Paraoerskovia marina TaxID=545619 RepID=A0A1H1MS81_9CELL|nr:hypothetical protein [Paraoerskovia marina]SDR89215.1 hypothetical protein SAMN04489860_0312 [Paraoerskovia marina]
MESETHESNAAQGRALALAQLIFEAHAWKHRQVDSIRLDAGDRGRRRTSIDCTLPADERLSWPGPGRGGQIIVPLGLFSKGPLRDFDIVDGDGRALSILGRDESATLACEIVCALLESVDDIQITPALERTIFALVVSLPIRTAETTDAVDFLATGMHAGDRVLTDDELGRLSTTTRAILHDLGYGYILFGIVPRPDTARRSIIKFSSYWTTTLHPDETPRASGLPPTYQRWRDVLRWRADVGLASLGIRPAQLELPIRGAGDARSYHLELHLPAEIECHSLALMATPLQPSGEIDRRAGPVSHAHGRFSVRWEDGEDRIALAALTTTGRGTARVAMLTSIATFAFFLLSLALPGAMPTLERAGDPSAVLLTLPAVALSIFLGVREHEIASVLLGPARVTIGLCAGLLAVAATALAWDLREPWLSTYWWIALCAAGLCALLHALGAVQRRRRAGAWYE